MEDETFKKVLDQQDQEFVRVLEDLIDILLQKWGRDLGHVP